MNTKKMAISLLTGLLCLAALPVTALAADPVTIDETNFPDTNFRKYVTSNLDMDGDGTLSEEEIAKVESISVVSKKIYSLKGIEYFTKLEELDCSGNKLSELDVSQNTALTILKCGGNYGIKKLDVSYNPALTTLQCTNDRISELDVSHNPALTTLICNSNKITELDVSQNAELVTLECSYNNLSELDVTHNSALMNLKCADMEITSLDVSHNPVLKTLDCSYNTLTTLDVSQNSALTELDVSHNKITSLDVSSCKALTVLTASYIRLKKLDLSCNTALTKVYLSNSRLTSINVSNLTELTYLDLEWNALIEELDVTDCPKLDGLYCAASNIKVLDLRNNPYLTNHDAAHLPSSLELCTAPVLKITTYKGQPKISWNEIGGALDYVILRSKDGVTYSSYKTVTGTSFTDTAAVVGTKYYYKVKANNAVTPVEVFRYEEDDGDGGDEGVDYSDYDWPESNVKSITCIPAAPVIKIARSSGKPKISWSAVKGVTKYWIYRSTDGGKTYSYLTSTTNTYYTNSKAAYGTRYYYKVKAVKTVDGTNYKSVYSNAKSLLTTLKAPTVSITRSSGHPKISWSAVKGADRYYIYRSTDGKTFTKYTSTTKTYYVNTKATAGKTYYYKVKAVNDSVSAAISAYSSKVSIKAK